MRATSSLLSVLLAAPLLSGLAVSSPLSNTQTHQIVFGDAEDATRIDPALRQGDLVDSMIAEAKSKGQDLSAWGLSEPEADDEDVKFGATVESVDLDDEIARARLLWEAAMENTVVSILPVSSSLSKVGKEWKGDEVKTMDPPGSGWIWQACGSGQEAAVLRELNVDPDPPVPGQNLTVKAKGIVNSPIREGTFADVVVKLGFIRLLSKRFDICQLAEDNDAEVKCPLEPGEYELTHTVELPKEIPPAKFNVHVNGKTQDDIDFVCMDLSIDFMHH